MKYKQYMSPYETDIKVPDMNNCGLQLLIMIDYSSRFPPSVAVSTDDVRVGILTRFIIIRPSVRLEERVAGGEEGCGTGLIPVSHHMLDWRHQNSNNSTVEIS